MENKLLILNMKMYMELAEIKKYIEQVNIQNDNVIICPTAIYLPYFVNKTCNIKKYGFRKKVIFFCRAV